MTVHGANAAASGNAAPASKDGSGDHIMQPALEVSYPVRIGQSAKRHPPHHHRRPPREMMSMKFSHLPADTDLCSTGRMQAEKDNLTVELGTKNNTSTSTTINPRIQKQRFGGRRNSNSPDYLLIFVRGAFWLEKVTDQTMLRHDGLRDESIELAPPNKTKENMQMNDSEDPDSWDIDNQSSSPITPEEYAPTMTSTTTTATNPHRLDSNSNLADSANNGTNFNSMTVTNNTHQYQHSNGPMGMGMGMAKTNTNRKSQPGVMLPYESKPTSRPLGGGTGNGLNVSTMKPYNGSAGKNLSNPHQRKIGKKALSQGPGSLSGLNKNSNVDDGDESDDESDDSEDESDVENEVSKTQVVPGPGMNQVNSGAIQRAGKQISRKTVPQVTIPQVTVPSATMTHNNRSNPNTGNSNSDDEGSDDDGNDSGSSGSDSDSSSSSGSSGSSASSGDSSDDD